MDKSKQVSDGVVEQNEGAASPRQPERLNSNGKPKKSAREMVEALVAEAVAEAVERRFQSAKDKRWDELEKQYGSLSELAERLGEGMGASAEHDAIAFNETASAVEDDVLAVPEGDAPATPAGSLTERVQALAKLPGLRENEDARAMLLRHAKPGGIEDYAALLEDLLRLGGSALKLESGRLSTPASMVIPGGGDAPADLRQAYERRRRALRPGDVQALMALKREFRQKGLDVF